MPVERTLARVEEDLAAGRRLLARQRLRGLIGSMPQRLDVRERLAEVYRLDGDLQQAGRWSYLARERNPEEVAAFERAFRDPVRLMRALEWRGSEEDATDDVARERLREVRARAEAKAKRKVGWEKPPRPEVRVPGRHDRLVDAGCAVVGVGLVLLAVLGLLALVVHGLQVLTRWLT
ncbi:MAG: DUF6584 family protein [Motilibacteraceae bacterium]